MSNVRVWFISFQCVLLLVIFFIINLSSPWIAWQLWHGKTQQTLGCTIHRQVAWAREESWAWPWFWAMVSSSRASPWCLLQLLLWLPSVMSYVLRDEINPSFSSHGLLMVRHFLPAEKKSISICTFSCYSAWLLDLSILCLSLYGGWNLYKLS